MHRSFLRDCAQRSPVADSSADWLPSAAGAFSPRDGISLPHAVASFSNWLDSDGLAPYVANEEPLTGDARHGASFPTLGFSKAGDDALPPPVELDVEHPRELQSMKDLYAFPPQFAYLRGSPPPDSPLQVSPSLFRGAQPAPRLDGEK